MIFPVAVGFSAVLDQWYLLLEAKLVRAKPWSCACILAANRMEMDGWYYMYTDIPKSFRLKYKAAFDQLLEGDQAM